MQYYCKVLFLYNSNALVWVVLIVKTVDDSSIGSNNKKMSFNEWYYMYYVFCFTIIMRPFFAFRQKSLFITGRTSIGCQK